MHRSAKPAAQPRTLRSVAESKNDSKNFGDAAVEKEPEYVDEAEAARPTKSRGRSAADPAPIK